MSDKIKISYSEKDVTQSLKKTQLKLGAYAGVVQSAQERVSKNGHLMVELTLAPLRDPDDMDSQEKPIIRNNIILPFKNPENADHVPMDPDTALSLNHAAWCALFPEEHPRMPMYQKDTDTWYFKGEEISAEDVPAKRHLVATQVFERSEAAWNDPEILEEKFVYFTVIQNGDYRNVGRMYSPESFAKAVENDDKGRLDLVPYDEKHGFKDLTA